MSKEESCVLIWNDFFSAYFCFGINRNKIILMLSSMGRFYRYVGCLPKVMYMDSFSVKLLRSYTIATMRSNCLVCGGGGIHLKPPYGCALVDSDRHWCHNKTVEINEYMYIIFISLIDSKGTLFFQSYCLAVLKGQLWGFASLKSISLPKM